MFMNHAGLVNRSSDEAERFYHDFLGLEKQKDYILPHELSVDLFHVKGDIRLMTFGMGDQKIEIFIYPGFNSPSPNIPHVGLVLDNLMEILERAGDYGVRVIKASHKDKTVYFTMDYSDNMIEIRQSS